MGELVAAGAQGGSRALTEQQQTFVTLLLNGDSPEVAGAGAGYTTAATIRAALASVGVQSALLAHRRAEIAGPMALAARKAINELITNEKTPAATRFAAAKWTLEQAGHRVEASDGQDKPLHEMTEAELAAFMAKAQAIVDNGGEAPKIVVAPDNGA